MIHDLPHQFPCLGLSALGLCSYDPTSPANVYLDISGAITALGFILAIQQFLKPIYTFRLRAQGLRLSALVFAMFIGSFFTVIGAVLPNLSFNHNSMLTYPIVWELLGGLIIIGTYAITAFTILRPAKINNYNLIRYVRAGANLLSAASDEDRIAFAEDLFSGNIQKLIKYASAWERAQGAAVALEFARLRETGAPMEIRGQPEISAFYSFSHRKELELGSYAGTLLQIISDPHFCSVLVSKYSWPTSSLITDLSEKRLYVPQAKPFIQMIAHQALMNDESIISKEVSYDGFSAVPLLAKSLFSDWFILRNYEPLSKLYFGYSKEPPSSYVSRLNGISEMMLQATVKGKSYWDCYYMLGVEQAYENLSHHIQFKRPEKSSIDFLIAYNSGISDLCKIALEGFEELEPYRRRGLFVHNTSQHYRNDLVEVITSIVFESLIAISNDFDGYGDEGWHHALEMFRHIYPSIGASPAGMGPLQQRLAIKIIEKLNDNMKGWYPALSRVLLSVIGPYKATQQGTNRTAHAILQDAVYRELQKLPALYEKDIDKIKDYLPSYVSYDPDYQTLTHKYRGGDTVVTKLSELNIPFAGNFMDESNWII